MHLTGRTHSGILAATIALATSGCTKLVSTSPADFTNGYATIYTSYSESRDGQACNPGTITYYKSNALAQEHWVGNGPPYYATPGTYRIAMWCQSAVDAKSGECMDYAYIDSGGPEGEVSLAKNHSYVVYCSGTGIKAEDRESFDRRHSTSNP